MKYFGIVDKNAATIFQFQWKIGNISDMFLQYSVLCGHIYTHTLYVQKFDYKPLFWTSYQSILSILSRAFLSILSILSRAYLKCSAEHFEYSETDILKITLNHFSERLSTFFCVSWHENLQKNIHKHKVYEEAKACACHLHTRLEWNWPDDNNAYWSVRR